MCYSSPISSALMSFRRCMSIFLASILLSISRLRWRPICLRGCWKDHCCLSTERQRVSRRDASTGQPRWRTISKRPRMMRPAFWRIITEDIYSEQLLVIHRHVTRNTYTCTCIMYDCLCSLKLLPPLLSLSLFFLSPSISLFPSPSPSSLSPSPLSLSPSLSPSLPHSLLLPHSPSHSPSPSLSPSLPHSHSPSPPALSSCPLLPSLPLT